MCSVERRSKPRINIPFPATVEGVDKSGKQFKVDTVLDNLSKEGIYLRLVPSVEQGTELSIVFRLSSSTQVEPSTPRVAVQGTVLRIEPKAGGVSGVAVKINPSRFL